MVSTHWEHFPHEADMGVRGIGNSKEEAFEQAAIAMSAVITDPAKISAVERVEIACAAPDDELLLVDWLNALIYEMATRKWLFKRFEVHIKEHQLVASVWGEPMDTDKHQLAVEIKGATYTALRVARERNGEWIAQCVVDV
jgi:SHS2 domain-containing protein